MEITKYTAKSLNLLNKQVNFIASIKRKVLAGSLLGLFLSMIIIFLEPFDTNEYDSDYRLIVLFGFGVLVTLVFIIQSILENRWYNYANKVWTFACEIGSLIVFFLFSGTIIYLYNHLFINNLQYSFKTHWWYYTHIVLAMIPIIAPVFIYVRQKFGERIIPQSSDAIVITGKNKNERLEILKNELFYIQSVENYIEIYYLKPDKQLQSKTFRQTLSQVHEQVSFLEKCHRSYLVNLECVSEIEGNSQRAKIAFKQIDTKIPLSKTLFKVIKSKVD